MKDHYHAAAEKARDSRGRLSDTAALTSEPLMGPPAQVAAAYVPHGHRGAGHIERPGACEPSRVGDCYFDEAVRVAKGR